MRQLLRSHKHPPDARQKQRAQADEVLGCWKDVMGGTYSRGGKVEQMAACAAERTNGHLPDCDFFIDAQPMADDIAEMPADESEFVGTDESVLRHNRHLYDMGHKDTVATVNRLVNLARKAGAEADDTVTSKKMVPPTGDKRTYTSLATNCWPSNPDDLDNPVGPWKCKDGHPFPGRHHIAPDFMMLMKLFNRVYKTAMAFYFTRDEYFAERTASRIRKFFLHPDTGMLPDLLYAQLKPGVSELGTPAGTIDMKNVAQLFDAVAMIRGSEHWRRDDDEGLKNWMGQYAEYLITDHVTPERCSVNNHGTYYDLQYISVLRYLDRGYEARNYVSTAVKERLRLQIRGAMLPTEMIRPKSYAYVNFQLEGYVRLAMQAEQLGVNLWDFRAAEYNSIMDAWDWMAPHWCDRSQSLWPVKQMQSPPLETYRPANWMGALYHRTRKPGAYTQRSLFYTQLFHQFKKGHDPHREMDWDAAVISQLPLTYMDDCFLTTCPERPVLAEDPPSFHAHCAPLDGKHSRVPRLTALATARTRDSLLHCAQGDTVACVHSLGPLALFLFAVVLVFGLLVARQTKRYGAVMRSLARKMSTGSLPRYARPTSAPHTPGTMSGTTSAGSSGNMSPLLRDVYNRMHSHSFGSLFPLGKRE